MLYVLQDCSDTIQLLGRDNIDEGKLWDYAVEAAAWSTELPKLDFAVSYENMSPDFDRDTCRVLLLLISVQWHAHTLAVQSPQKA